MTCARDCSDLQPFSRLALMTWCVLVLKWSSHGPLVEMIFSFPSSSYRPEAPDRYRHTTVPILVVLVETKRRETSSENNWIQMDLNIVIKKHMWPRADDYNDQEHRLAPWHKSAKDGALVAHAKRKGGARCVLLHDGGDVVGDTGSVAPRPAEWTL